MSCLAVNKDGSEVKIIGNYKRGSIFWYGEFGSPVKLTRGTIESKINRELTWEDEPVELKDV